MKIALFTDTFPPVGNGVAYTVHISARTLAEQGHEVRVYTVSDQTGEELTQNMGGSFTVGTLPSLPIAAYPGARLSLPLGFALRDVKSFNPDVIHVHTPFAVGWEGVLSSKILKIPAVGTHHTFFDHYLKHVHLNFDWAKKFSWKYTVMFYNRVSHIVSPTKSLADELLVNGLKKPTVLLPNSINKKIFNDFDSLEKKAEIKKNLGITSKSLVYLGRLSYEKSVDGLLYITKDLLQKFPDLKLILIGDGTEKVKLQSLALDLNIQEHVVFTGFLHGKDLANTLAAADIFVTASKSENMPLSVLEAEAVGLPIIAVSSLGMSEIVQDGHNGFLLPADKPEQMTEKIDFLLSNDDILKEFSANSRKLAEEYSEDAITKRLLDLY